MNETILVEEVNSSHSLNEKVKSFVLSETFFFVSDNEK